MYMHMYMYTCTNLCLYIFSYLHTPIAMMPSSCESTAVCTISAACPLCVVSIISTNIPAFPKKRRKKIEHDT